VLPATQEAVGNRICTNLPERITKAKKGWGVA
jgi:hypothetical protein